MLRLLIAIKLQYKNSMHIVRCKVILRVNSLSDVLAIIGLVKNLENRASYDPRYTLYVLMYAPFLRLREI
jgi:hypothetical protein